MEYMNTPLDGTKDASHSEPGLMKVARLNSPVRMTGVAKHTVEVARGHIGEL